MTTKKKKNQKSSKTKRRNETVAENKPQTSQQTIISVWALITALTACLIGACLALYASYQTIQIHWHGLENPSGCSVNAWINCDAAQSSSYAFLMGIPIAWWGFMYYLWVGLLLLWAKIRKGQGELARRMAIIASLLALVF